MWSASWDPVFEEFVLQRWGALLRTTTFLVGDRHTAEDVLQTALLRTARRWRQARDNPEAYVRRVLVNLAKDGRRNRGRRVGEAPFDLPDGRSCPEPAVAEPTALEARDELVAALRLLPLRQRTAVVLRYWEDLSVAETAALMGCSEGTVKSSANRGLVRLRDLLTPDHDLLLTRRLP